MSEDAITQIVMSMFDVPFHLDQPVLSHPSPASFLFFVKMCFHIRSVLAARLTGAAEKDRNCIK